MTAQSTASTPPTSAARPARATPCESDPNARRFDFWIGEWEVTARGAVVGYNKIEKVSGGCALHEFWTDANGETGHSLNAYNSALGMWQQFWVGQRGTVTEYRESEWLDRTLSLRSAARGRDGKIQIQRLQFTPNPDGTVRQHGELSIDDGRTWTTSYDLLYTRKKS